MITELGHFALILALCLAVVQAVVPLLGAHVGNVSWMNLARPAAQIQFALIALSFACLTYAFLTDDFSVKYVADNSNTLLPTIYKISAVWGAHEGSLLLWVLILSLWALAVSVFSRNLPLDYAARVLGIMGLISIGFLTFMLLTSNPFTQNFPVPHQGRDLNPLLQDPGLAIHPPMLYTGYVGFSVAFAFALAALLGGRLDATWARWSRPWTTMAWVFLTIGIALGSWWAYYELGWGGWWFWDPVENASFMPWLVGTALIHSLAVTEKRGSFKAWTVLLAIMAFSLSLLGTFLVRSGVLTSVHAFATDPGRGLYILIFLCIVIGGSLVLYAWRGSQVSSTGRFELLSRESLMLINNVLLVVVTLSVLFGTLYPLIMDAAAGIKLSVGPPYFNLVFMALMTPLVIVIGIGPLIRWKRHGWFELWRHTRVPLALAAMSYVLGIVLLQIDDTGRIVMAALGIMLGVWIVASLTQDLVQKFKHRRISLAHLRALGLHYYGMWIAHLGIAVFIVGVTVVSTFQIEDDVRLLPGQHVELSGYQFVFEGVQQTRGPNYIAQRGTFVVNRDNQYYTTLYPEKRVYTVQTMPMTEAAINSTLWRDLYVSLGEPVGPAEQGAWLLRIYYKPFQSWIWLAATLMALGGLLAASDPRYRRVRAQEQAKQTRITQELIDELLVPAENKGK